MPESTSSSTPNSPPPTSHACARSKAVCMVASHRLTGSKTQTTYLLRVPAGRGARVSCGLVPSGLSSLTHLNVSFNPQLVGTLPESLVASLPRLARLHACGTALAGEMPAWLPAVTSLQAVVTLDQCGQTSANCAAGYTCTAMSMSIKATACSPGWYSGPGATECTNCTAAPGWCVGCCLGANADLDRGCQSQRDVS